MLLHSAAFVLGLACAGPLAAEPAGQLAFPGALADLGTAAVAHVDESGLIALADGRTLRLAGVDLARGRLGHEAIQALAALAALGPFALGGDGPPEDRYGRLVAQAFAADGTWIEGELLRRGLARVATTVDHRAAADALYGAERAACARRIGLWGDPDTALRRPTQAAHMIDSWQVVDGVVDAVEPRRGGLELRFGDDPARDFAVRVPAEVVRTMGYDPAALVGRHVRVRGWIGKGVGPLMVLSHAEQIELVGRARPRLVDDP